MASIFTLMSLKDIEMSIFIERNQNRPKIMKTKKYQAVRWPTPATMIYERSVSKTFVTA